jgi:hypothetical protein
MLNTLSSLLVRSFICCCKLRLVYVSGLSFISYTCTTIRLHTIQFDVIPAYLYTSPNYNILLKHSYNKTNEMH